MSRMDGSRSARPPARAPRGMVAASHHLAGAAGLAVLRRGGNAVDAAVAASAVLCVVSPHAAGLGGDGFWLIHDPTEGGARAINASGPAAQLATIDWYRERGHEDAIPERGPLAALTVPGAVDGWRLAHERWGTLPWEELFDDAIRYARDGVPVGRSLAAAIVDALPVLERHSSAGRRFLRDGRVRGEGERIRFRDLADTLGRLARDGARLGFYEGETAERVGRVLDRRGSPLRPGDFAAYEAEWTAPISVTYRGHALYEIPPNSQGIAALEMLNLLQGFAVPRWGDDSAAYIHHLAEAAKLAYADRDAWVTDPQSVTLPISRLLADDYADQRRGLIDPDRALDRSGLEAGIPFKASAFRARRRLRAADGGEGPTQGQGKGHGQGHGQGQGCCVVDEAGLAVVTVLSLRDPFGSAEVAGDTGIVLQNRGADLRLDETHPNRLEPGRRTFHTLAPAMLFRDHRPMMLLAATGGGAQPETQAMVVTRLLDFDRDVQRAVEAPRWAIGPGGGAEDPELFLEAGIPDDVAGELERLGHRTVRIPDGAEAVGRAQAIRIDWRHGVLEGGADPRSDGIAVGY